MKKRTKIYFCTIIRLQTCKYWDSPVNMFLISYTVFFSVKIRYNTFPKLKILTTVLNQLKCYNNFHFTYFIYLLAWQFNNKVLYYKMYAFNLFITICKLSKCILLVLIIFILLYCLLIYYFYILYFYYILYIFIWYIIIYIYKLISVGIWLGLALNKSELCDREVASEVHVSIKSTETLTIFTKTQKMNPIIMFY